MRVCLRDVSAIISYDSARVFSFYFSVFLARGVGGLCVCMFACVCVCARVCV